MNSPQIFIGILILVHNAPEYVEITIRSLNEMTNSPPHEVIVLDNASGEETRRLLRSLHSEGLIDKLHFSETNTLFAGGNNLAASLASEDASHFLLLNSDVEVKNAAWLDRLVENHRRGATAYGIAQDPLRVDGYCLLVDADLYREYPLDEGHQWWWSVTKQQAQLLNSGCRVAGFYEHEEYLHHFGGKSGSAFASAKGMNVTRREVYAWFGGRKPVVLDNLPRLPLSQRLRALGRRAKWRFASWRRD
ncbi:glycosyltransferase [Microbacterium sp. W1N]|uniref:glycosyltransferase family 2 protein n=1 Tax=Microbacterium festucae TaxID=2977531 RepID=UPI0021C18F56|nr:glycosyltransferase [Microbacterium festucae]MCT9819031.1 glycosyltransferase [Microbacterium festucae]